MSKLLIPALLLVLCGAAPPATAQEEASKLELYGGYDYVRYNARPRLPGVPLSESANANGVSGQIAYNANQHLGLVADLSGYLIARQGFANTYQISYLFGPRINLRRSRVTPFTQVLLGRAWAADGFRLGSVTAFGMTAGGGVDVGLSKHIAIRPAQAEYLLTKFADGNNDRQNNFRFGAGVVLRLGGR